MVLSRALNVVAAVAPWLIIGGLLYAALFVEPEAVVRDLPEPALGSRDFYYGVAHPAEDVVWLAGTWGKVIRSNDGGETWTIRKTPTRENLQSIVAWDNERAAAVGNEGVAIRTEDGGKTWVEVTEIPKSKDRNKLVSLRKRGAGEAWAVGLGNAILRTTDYGKTWQRMAEERDKVWTDIAFPGDRVYLVGEFGATMHSDDGGETWVEGQAPVSATLNSVAFRNATHGIAVGGEGDVVITSDGGDSWAKVPSVIDRHLYDVTWLNDHWFAVGDKGRYVKGKGPNWEGGRLSLNDLSWHTRIAVTNGTAYITGASAGLWTGEEWARWSDEGLGVREPAVTVSVAEFAAPKPVH